MKKQLKKKRYKTQLKLFKVISYVTKYIIYQIVFLLHLKSRNFIVRSTLTEKHGQFCKITKNVPTHPFVVQFMNNFPLSNPRHKTTSTITIKQRFNLRETWRSRGAWRNKPGFWSFLWRFCYLYSNVYKTPRYCPIMRAYLW